MDGIGQNVKNFLMECIWVPGLLVGSVHLFSNIWSAEGERQMMNWSLHQLFLTLATHATHEEDILMRAKYSSMCFGVDLNLLMHFNLAGHKRTNPWLALAD